MPRSRDEVIGETAKLAIDVVASIIGREVMIHSDKVHNYRSSLIVIEMKIKEVISRYYAERI